MSFGWVIAGLGLVLAIYPRPLVASARGWRLGSLGPPSQGTLHAARIGAAIAMIAGLVIALA